MSLVDKIALSVIPLAAIGLLMFLIGLREGGFSVIVIGGGFTYLHLMMACEEESKHN